MNCKIYLDRSLNIYSFTHCFLLQADACDQAQNVYRHLAS
jgi:hypothetical protein